VLYKTKLPFIVCFNKIDVTPHAFALEWLRDYDSFRAAADAGNTYSHVFVSIAVVYDLCKCTCLLMELFCVMNSLHDAVAACRSAAAALCLRSFILT
jgi:hypothetical protein